MVDSTHREYRTAAFTASDDDSFRISGYALTFGEPYSLGTDNKTGLEYHEVIDRSALDEADLSDVYLNTEHAGKVYARTRNGSLKLTVDEHGLKVDADLSGSDAGKDLYRSIKAGLYDRMSFAFTVADETYDTGTHTREIRKIDRVFDVAVVALPANPQTEVYARSKFWHAVKAEHGAYVAERRQAADQIFQRYAELDHASPEDFKTEEEIKRIEKHNEDMPYFLRSQYDKRDPIFRQMAEIRNKIDSSSPYDTEIASDALHSLQKLEKQLDKLREERAATLEAVANGAGTVIERFGDDVTGKVEKMENENIEIRSFQKYVSNGLRNMTDEERRALNIAGTGAVLPVEIQNRIIHDEKFSDLLNRATIYNESGAGTLKIPVASNNSATWKQELSPVDATAPELTSIDLGGFELMRAVSMSAAVESMATDQFVTMMSELVSAEVVETLENAFIAGDGSTIPLTGLQHLSWTSGKNAISCSGDITAADLASGLALLPQKYARNAIMVMNAATAIQLVSLFKGTQEYAFDLSTGASAFMGKEIVISEHCAANEIYVVDPKELYVRFAMPMTVEVDRTSGFLSASTNLRCLTVVDAKWNPAAAVKVAKA